MAADHEMWMQQALRLAARGEGLTRPNPPVGAVAVKGGKTCGEGWHRRAGGPHAEVIALRRAGKAARGSTLYITLEPCSTHGRTPPCTERILESGVRRVVIASIDPNPQHAGRGVRLLRRRGVEVITGVCRSAGDSLIEPFRNLMCKGRPWVTLKLGMTLDGKIADASRRSQWITGAPARQAVQAWRRRADAILVGAGTVQADDPSLWPRPDRGRRPWRVIMDTRARTNPNARVYCDEHAPYTVIAVGESVSTRIAARYTHSGCIVVRVPEDHIAAVQSVCLQLGQMGALHILCEGGGELAAALIQARCVDEMICFIAPRIMGGADSVGSIGGVGWSLPDLPQWRFVEQGRVGEDILVRARPMAKT